MPTISLPGSASPELAGTLPDIEPIGLVHLADPFDDPGFVFEPKDDGLRGLVYSSGTACDIRLWPEVTFERLEELRERITPVLGGREAILDGQVVALNRQGRPVFPELIRGQGYLAFAAFDLLWLDGADLRSSPLSLRKRLLTKLLPEDTGPLYKVLTLDEYGRALFGAIRKMDLEGIVAKRKDDTYGPETIWYEVRNPLYSASGLSSGEFRAARPWAPARSAT